MRDLGFDRVVRCEGRSRAGGAAEARARCVDAVGVRHEGCVVARLASEKLAMSFGDVAVSLGRLEAHGWLMCTAGWFERVGAR